MLHEKSLFRDAFFIGDFRKWPRLINLDASTVNSNCLVHSYDDACAGQDGFGSHAFRENGSRYNSSMVNFSAVPIYGN